MKKKYAPELGMLKDMFPDWTDVDLVFALQETDGDVPATVDKITQGNVSQFAEVKKAKDRARSKVKDEPATAGAADKSVARGGRGRGGFEGARGGRARGSDRARGGFRGGRGGHATTNGAAKDVPATSVPTTESSAWDNSTNTEAVEGNWDTSAQETAKEPVTDVAQSAWANVVSSEATPATASEGMKSSLIPEGGAKKSWASMFSQPKPAPASAAVKQASQPPPKELVASGQLPSIDDDALAERKESESVVPPVPAIEEPAPAPQLEALMEPTPMQPPGMPESEDLALIPSKDPLTEENVEHLPDESIPPATQTVASTAGSMDPRNLTPLPSQPAPIGRPPVGGYATSAYRATGQPGRSASYQRRVQEQQEAVVMPGHNAVDRATVQFGSMGLSSEAGPDVDEDREEPETQKALQHSPPSQPRTSLPPVPRQAGSGLEGGMLESLPTPKQAPGLPPASMQNQQQMQEATMAHALAQDQSQINPNYAPYARYGQPGMQQDSGAQQQKPYDPFSHQAQASQYEQYGAQQAPQQQQQQQSQSGFGGLTSAPNDYSNYYTSNEQRNAYNQYYGSSYGHQDARNSSGQQDIGMSQHRSASGFGAAPTEAAYPSQPQQQVSKLLSIQEFQAACERCGVEEGRKVVLTEPEHALMRTSHANKPIVPHLQMMFAQANKQADVAAPMDSPLCRQLRELGDITNRNSTFLSSPLPSINISNMSTMQAQSRYAEAPGSGQDTPNPLMGGQSQANPSAQQSQHSMLQAQGQQQQQGGQQGGYGGASAAFPYGHPYYNSPYQQAYQNQFAYNQPVSGYGGNYPSKQGGMYGGPQGYGMGSHSSYEQHSGSPANAGAFGQTQQPSSMRSASGMSSGLGGGMDDYGRGATQGASHQPGSGFGGGMNDPFARSASGFGGQGSYGQQSMAGGPEDSLKAFNDSKSGSSPALGQPGRPGSAANNQSSSTQSGLPPPQGHQSGFGGGFPGFPGQGSQYGGLGGLGSHQQSQSGQGGYGAYGAGGFGQTYGGYGSRGGWGSNYGAH